MCPCSFHANPVSLLQGHFHWFPWLWTATTLLPSTEGRVSLWENHLHPSSDASRVTNNHFLLTESPWKVNPGSMFFRSDFFFKDVCIDFINANITMFVIQKEVITASVLIMLGPEPQSISCSSVSCFYLMFLELCLKKHWRKNKDHQGFVHK